jgi:hypothetical protein
MNIKLYLVVVNLTDIDGVLIVCVQRDDEELADVVSQTWYTPTPQFNVELLCTNAPVNTRVWADVYWDRDRRAAALHNLIWKGPRA